MTTIMIQESGMSFGPFSDAECFYIEKSNSYERIKEGVKIAEFLLLRTQKNKTVAWVIEAKSSSPKTDQQAKFTAYIDEIRAKLTNAFLLTMAIGLERHSEEKQMLPAAFKELDFSLLNFRFILVINGHQPGWLIPVQDALSLAMQSLVKTWALPAMSTVVISDVQAHKHGLVGAQVLRQNL